MNRFKRLLLALLVVLLLLALPSTALASKRIYKARLTTTNELHEVVGSNAAGNFHMVSYPDYFEFHIRIVRLSGPPTGAHIHGPATTAETAPVLISLCGDPAPAAVATCTYDPDTQEMIVDGEITGSLLAQWGLPVSVFRDYLENELTYVNVHTALNPMGEVRGQIIRFR